MAWQLENSSDLALEKILEVGPHARVNQCQSVLLCVFENKQKVNGMENFAPLLWTELCPEQINMFKSQPAM
jgi:hypothetical protein